MNEQPFVENVCQHCGVERTPEGHDGCLGTLRGDVMNACCGHGGLGEGAYIQYWNGKRLGEKEALKEFERLRNITQDKQQ